LNWKGLSAAGRNKVQAALTAFASMVEKEKAQATGQYDTP
jgi:hypothetical protein